MAPRDPPDPSVILPDSGAGTRRRSQPAKRHRNDLGGGELTSDVEEIAAPTWPPAKKAKSNTNGRNKANTTTKSTESTSSNKDSAADSATHPTSTSDGQASSNTAPAPKKSTPAVTVIEIEDEEDKPKQKDDFTHRLKMPGRPTQSCAADHPAFQKRESLAFTFLVIKNPQHIDDGVKLAECEMVCNFCLSKNVPKPTVWKWKAATSKGSTSNFLNHFKVHHPNVWDARTAEDMATRFPNRTEDPQEQEQPTLHSWTGSAFDVALADRLKAEWIATRNHPFTECEDESTKRFLTHLRPGYGKKLVGRDQQKVHIQEQYEKAMERLKKLLQNTPGRKAFAADAWTSQNNLAFLALIACFITEDWKLKQVLIDFPQLLGAHTGKNMAHMLMKRLKELGIEQHFLTLTADNATNNDTLRETLASLLAKASDYVIDYDADKMTIRCLPHAIHLAVREFLLNINAAMADFLEENEVETAQDFTAEMAEQVCSVDRELAEKSDEEVVASQERDGVDVKSVVQKVRQISKISRSSPQRSEDFHRTIKIVNALEKEEDKKLQLLNLILDVVTRWNSTYFMLKRAKDLRGAVDEICQRNDLYRKYRVSADEWDVVEVVMGFLEIFREASEQMSAAEFPTLSASLLVYTKLLQQVSTFMKTQAAINNPELLSGLEACKVKLEKYFDKSTGESEYYYAAVVLEHRVKHGLFNNNPDLFSHAWRQEMETAFKRAVSTYGTTVESRPTTPSISRSSSGMRNLYHDEELLGSRQPQDNSPETVDAEYARYLAFQVQPEEADMDALAFWKKYGASFPRLAGYARDVLAIPGSSVSVERALSLARNVIGDYRHSLDAETIRMLMLYRSLLIAEGVKEKGYRPQI